MLTLPIHPSCENTDVPVAPPPSRLKIEPEDFPPLPEVAWKVLQMTSDLCCGVQNLERVVSRDQALTSRILKIANSAFFGLRREVRTVGHAAVVLGNRRLRGLVIASSIGGVLYQTPSGRLLWEHALGVGLSSSEIARSCAYPDPEEAFVAGLLHDIGKALLDYQYPQLYARVMERLLEEPSTSSPILERQIFGTDHSQAGLLLVEAWSLPLELGDAIGWHHAPVKAPHDPFLASLVNLADGLCRKSGIGPLESPELDLGNLEGTAFLEVSGSQLETMFDHISVKLKQDKDLFGLS